VAVAGALRLGVVLVPHVVGLLASATSSPTPSPSSSAGRGGGLGTEPSAPKGLDPEDVSPGISGFLATAAVVLACIFIIISLVRRLRRIRYRADLEARGEGGTPPPVRQLPPDDSVPGTVTSVTDVTGPTDGGRTTPPRLTKRSEHLE
jgi:hypothetical protein